MRVTLLGTGSADGLPNPWCRCPTCTDQRLRGKVRTPTSALVDGRLLLDSGPEAPLQAARLGLDLSEVEVVAIGHAHHDHLDPAFLLYRGWVSQRPLDVVGPAPVIDQCRQWLDPDQRVVRFHTVSAGDVLTMHGYTLRALAARHEAFGEAVLYVVEDTTARLLYATDTGTLPPATLAALAGAAFDAALLEETFGTRTDLGADHLQLETFAQTLTDLRLCGAIIPTTQVVAVHLSHHNPPLPELRRRLAEVGAVVHPDGTVLEL